MSIDQPTRLTSPTPATDPPAEAAHPPDRSSNRSAASASRGSGAKFPVNCELPHIGAPKNMRLFRQAQRDPEEMQMRIGIGIAVAVVVAIGLIWSVAAMSELVPVVSGG